MVQSIYATAEDRVTESVIRRLIRELWDDWRGEVIVKIAGGRSYVENLIPKLNQAASQSPIIVLADLDSAPCPSDVLVRWFPRGKSRKMLCRLAVREVESWLLADSRTLPGFLGVSLALLPRSPDTLVDPKTTLINLARRSRFRRIREGIVPRPKSGTPIGSFYNDLLAEYVELMWDVSNAKLVSMSLNRACAAFVRQKASMLY